MCKKLFSWLVSSVYFLSNPQSICYKIKRNAIIAIAYKTVAVTIPLAASNLSSFMATIKIIILGSTLKLSNFVNPWAATSFEINSCIENESPNLK
ncbi:hypothetical protein [Plebeiibacterium marinum]|uniref:Uncharacterized protein n=1 Tax=Plebeiibacterium marinum TaxID=2992111 RepID=A0AAE3MHB9_9BACT|nr:hypothetical protein [Plebeiobacterium marinum]MCW3807731.1 hypothetical protein [Plebeiobacterium marinum]